MSRSNDELDFADVRVAPNQEPFTLVPVVSDILRTRYCVPGSIFLVESIEAAPVSKSGRWQAIQVLLGDGELCIQALLNGPLHRFVETGEVSVGCYVRVDKFEINITVAQTDEKSESMVYLTLEDLMTVGWNDPYRLTWEAERGEALEELAAEDDLDFEAMELEYTEKEVEEAQIADPKTDAAAVEAEEVAADEEEDEDEEAAFEDAFDRFEALTFPLKTKRTDQDKLEKSSTSQAVALPKDWHDHQTPLRLTTLRSVPRLPYAQNWTCNVLAVIASLSPIESSYLPPYRQRVARLADPSSDKRIHLTVFLEPENFEPKIGSAVLLVGVKNHRFDGGSLKKYASDGDKTGGTNWWFENPWHLGWCDVDGIKSWWDQHEQD